ncbi:MAG TPA: ABC transporter substrate-binding protein [Streptosporangiaceae bacterium]|nr:ABC transporter substrate-binding protein [Streptosporangiaceae bacterium]
MTTRVQFGRRAAITLLAAGSLFAAAPLAQARTAGPASPHAGPVKGGTLRLVAAAGPDHIDTIPAYYTADYILERAYARQLVSYRTVPDPSVSSTGWTADTTPVADAATAVPTIANGGITGGGKTYTFHIKPGVRWNTPQPRQVTAADFLREFKTFCNPAPGGFVGNLGYYTETIAGLSKYCRAESSFFVRHRITAANIAGFAKTHAIAGITAVNKLTIRFRLLKPASDFLYILALPFASARPAEYDKYLPNSLRLDQHTISDGPYQITRYVPGLSMVMAKNPAWRQSTDSIRHQYVSKITLTIGVTSASTAISDLQHGTFDLMQDTSVPPSAISRLHNNADFHIWPGNALLPYLTLNVRSPNARHAIRSLAVRKAIEFGVNKAAVSRVLGGPKVAPILNSAEPPGNLGFVASNPYPSPGGKGSVAKCKAELARSGHGKSLRLNLLYADDAQNTAVFRAIRASLKLCGIQLKGRAEPGSSFFVDLGNVAVTNRPGTWDLALPGWLPDWFGDNGRAMLDPLFRTDCVINTLNYACYSNHKVDKLMTEAETATSYAKAAILWTQAEKQIMADAAVVPLINGQSPVFSSSRVREAGLSGGVVFSPIIGGPDVTNIWLKKG